MDLGGELLTWGGAVFLFLALALAFSFEFVNGFHDTANAVATVIYTNTLPPEIAAVWSGIWNLIGVLTSSGAVAYSIIALLPVDLVLHIGSNPGFAMIFSLLVSALLWNVGTWYLGLPASSSHSLIGSILGVGLSYSLIASGHTLGQGVNWEKARDVGLSLLISPLIGFIGAALLLFLFKLVARKAELYRSPAKGAKPPAWIRGVLLVTCTGVSFAHGSNDGQKGMGLIMLILVGILPGAFALKMDASPAELHALTARAPAVTAYFYEESGGIPISSLAEAETELGHFIKSEGRATLKTYGALALENRAVTSTLLLPQSFSDLSIDARRQLRDQMYLLSESIDKLAKHPLSPADKKILLDYKDLLNHNAQYIPVWVKVLVALALGTGTMIGWKRVVVTVGERIGKQHLTYGSGAAAELVAMGTILAANRFGLPVSTTHVLCSGVAGAMAANGSGLQAGTLRSLLLAWVLTVPVCMVLGAGLFSASLFLLLHFFGA